MFLSAAVSSPRIDPECGLLNLAYLGKDFLSSLIHAMNWCSILSKFVFLHFTLESLCTTSCSSAKFWSKISMQIECNYSFMIWHVQNENSILDSTKIFMKASHLLLFDGSPPLLNVS